MKTFKSLCLVILAVGLLASCTNRRYSHMTRFQHQAKPVAEKTKDNVRHDHVAPKISVFENSTKTEIAQQEIPVNQRTDRKADVSTSTVQNKLEDTDNQLPSTKSGYVTKNPLKVKALAKSELEKNTESVSQVSKVPFSTHRVLKKLNKPKDDSDELIYWILVIVLICVILWLLEAILGPFSGILIAVLLIVLLGHILGLW